MKKKIIVANWKMNYGFDESDAWLAEFVELAQDSDLKKVEPIVCPPFLLIDNMSGSLMDHAFERIEEGLQKTGKKIENLSEDDLAHYILGEKSLAIGAQDCHFADSGAFTGDVSAKLLSEVGCEFVILGHSERRALHFENDEIVAKKLAAAHENKLTPILCVGENKEQRDAGKHLEFVYRQLMASIPRDVKFERLIVAYEPIWAIGTGVVPDVKQIAEMAKLIKKVFAEKLQGVADEFAILYGGSASTENSAEILSIANIDGLLVGGASLEAGKFFEICKSAV